MYNHVRTLLVNRAGPDVTGFAAEAIPAAFRPVDLPAHLRAVRAWLFGRRPDAYMLNYRARQYLTLLHASALADHVTAPDPRVTYATGEDAALAGPAAFAPVVTAVGPAGGLAVLGRPAAPDAAGPLRREYFVDVLGDTVAVTAVAPDRSRAVHPLAYAGGRSAAFDLPGSGYQARLTEHALASAWAVVAVNRPQWSLGAVVAGLDGIGEPVLLALFGPAPAEPYLTFRNAWRDGRDLPTRLSGILLALAYRTDEVRLGGTGRG